MNEYKIYFEIFGKKLKTTIFADSENEAKQKLLNKITWHKIEKAKSKEVEHLENIIFGNK
jgi:type II secretory pathway component PulF